MERKEPWSQQQQAANGGNNGISTSNNSGHLHQSGSYQQQQQQLEQQQLPYYYSNSGWNYSNGASASWQTAATPLRQQQQVQASSSTSWQERWQPKQPQLLDQQQSSQPPRRQWNQLPQQWNSNSQGTAGRGMASTLPAWMTRGELQRASQHHRQPQQQTRAVPPPPSAAAWMHRDQSQLQNALSQFADAPPPSDYYSSNDDNNNNNNSGYASSQQQTPFPPSAFPPPQRFDQVTIPPPPPPYSRRRPSPLPEAPLPRPPIGPPPRQLQPVRRQPQPRPERSLGASLPGQPVTATPQLPPSEPLSRHAAAQQQPQDDKALPMEPSQHLSRWGAAVQPGQVKMPNTKNVKIKHAKSAAGPTAEDAAERLDYCSDQLVRLLLPNVPRPPLPPDRDVTEFMTTRDKVQLFWREMRHWNGMHQVYDSRQHANCSDGSMAHWYAAIESLAEAYLRDDSYAVENFTADLLACSQSSSDRANHADQTSSPSGKTETLPTKLQLEGDGLLLQSPITHGRQHDDVVEERLSSLKFELESTLQEYESNKTDQKLGSLRIAYEQLKALDSHPRQRPLLFASPGELRTVKAMTKAAEALGLKESSGESAGQAPRALSDATSTGVANGSSHSSVSVGDNDRDVHGSAGVVAGTPTTRGQVAIIEGLDDSGIWPEIANGTHDRQQVRKDDSSVKHDDDGGGGGGESSVHPIGGAAPPGTNTVDQQQPIGSPEKGAQDKENCTSTLSTPVKRDIVELYGDTAEDPPQGKAKHRKTASMPSSTDGGVSSAAITQTTSSVTNNVESAADPKQKAALLRAKVNLKKAVLAKMKALEQKRSAEQARQQGNPVIRPINALLKGGLDSLLISGINSSGPAEKVRFDTTLLLEDDSKLHEDARQGKINALEANSPEEAGTESGEHVSRSPTLDESIAQAKRRLELKLRLIEAKEKKQQLEEAAKQREQLPVPDESRQAQDMNCDQEASRSVLQSAASTASSQFSDAEENASAEDQKPAAKPTRADLMIRKKEAERNRAVTRYKLILSKQERIKADQSSEAKKIAANLEDCTKKLTDAKSKLESTQQSIRKLSMQKEVIDELMAEKVSELVKKRKLLHDCRKELSRRSKA